MRIFSRQHILLLSLLVMTLGFTGKEKYVELDGTMNGRGSAKFVQSANNIEFVLNKNTKAEILKSQKMPSGNFAFQVKIVSGPYANKTTWVYYNSAEPTLKLYENCPSSWIQKGLSNCSAAQTPERATHAITREVTSSNKVPQEIQVVASPPLKAEAQAAPPCFNCSPASSPINSFGEQLLNLTKKNALSGAYRVMADIYQSCHVLNLPLFNPKTDDQMAKFIRKSTVGTHVRSIPPQNLSAVARTHFYLRDLPEVRNPQCQDLTKNPPLYHYGGRPNFLPNNEIDLLQTRRTGGVPITGIDCSAFVSTAFSVSGLKLTPQIKTTAQNITNSDTFTGFNSRNSCFDRPEFQKDQTIKSGDVIAWRGHVFMIDQVGRDPFGIQKAKSFNRFPKSIANCSRYQPPLSDLSFSLIQSTGTGSLPAMRVEARNYGSGTALRSYMNLAVQACRAQFTSGSVPPDANRGTTLLRHKGDSDSRCMMEENKIPKLKGEECTQGCFKEAV